jgi:hypothetical protein
MSNCSTIRNIFIFFFLALLSFQVQAEKVYIGSLSSPTLADLEKIINKDTIVFINLDETIITPKSNMFRYGSPYKNTLESIIAKSNNDPYLNSVINTFLNNRKMMLIENDWLKFIEELKQKSPMVIGLSKMNSGVYRSFKTPEDWKYKELESLGIKFTDKIADKDAFIVKSLKFPDAVFYKGILFTGIFTKSEAILAFLKMTELSPKVIIVIDSIESDVEQLELSFSRNFNGRYFVVSYLGAKNIQGKIDLKLIEFQYKQLMQKGKWLEDEEAVNILR